MSSQFYKDVGKHTKWQKYEAKTKDKGSEIIDTIIP
jgi:hypothetical protein